jgi:hypothetical protein
VPPPWAQQFGHFGLDTDRQRQRIATTQQGVVTGGAGNIQRAAQRGRKKQRAAQPRQRVIDGPHCPALEWITGHAGLRSKLAERHVGTGDGSAVGGGSVATATGSDPEEGCHSRTRRQTTDSAHA